MENKYYIYKTTNNINGKFYYGKHYGLLDDDYLGSGTIIKQAIKKYGKENFTKEIIYIATDEADAYEMESCIVGQDLVEDKMCYNQMIGGKGAASGKNNHNYGKKQTIESNIKRSKALKGQRVGVKNHNYGKFGKENPNAKKVDQFTKDGKFIKTWDSMMDINRKLGITFKQVSKCCREINKSAGGFIFKYHKGEQSWT